MSTQATSGNWIEEGRAALVRYRENDTIDQADTDALATFVEQALIKTTWDGRSEPLTTEEWVVRFDGAVRRYPTHAEAVAECERIVAKDMPRMNAAGWPTGWPTISHEMHSKLRAFIEASEILEREIYQAEQEKTP